MSENVKKVIETLKSNPSLLTPLNEALNRIIAEAGVDLTKDEVKELLSVIGDSINPDKALDIHVH